MTRGLTAGMVTAVTDNVYRAVLFVELDYPSGYTRVWSGIGTYSWDSKDWIGAGNLGAVSDIEETEQLRAAGITLSLSGIPSELISLALTEAYRGRPVKIWLGAFDSDLALIAEPIKIFAGRLDVQSIVDGGETSSIQISCENKLIDLSRPRPLRWTDYQNRLLKPVKFWSVDSAAWTNQTTNFADQNITTELFAAQNDYIYFGSTAKFYNIAFDLSVLASATITPTFEYWDGAWQSLTVTDGTVGFTLSEGLSWTAADSFGWTTTQVNGESDFYWYYVRIKRGTVSLTTAPTFRKINAIGTSDDLGLEYLSALMNKEIFWGV